MDDPLFASPKSRTTALLLSIFLGFAGAHRHYAGKHQSAILQMCTLGGIGLWWLYDIILIAAGSFRDRDGNVIADWEGEADRLVPVGTAAALLDEVDQLRADVAELHERLEFAERLLARPDNTDHRA